MIRPDGGRIMRDIDGTEWVTFRTPEQEDEINQQVDSLAQFLRDVIDLQGELYTAQRFGDSRERVAELSQDLLAYIDAALNRSYVTAVQAILTATWPDAREYADKRTKAPDSPEDLTGPGGQQWHQNPAGEPGGQQPDAGGADAESGQHKQDEPGQQ